MLQTGRPRHSDRRILIRGVRTVPSTSYLHPHPGPHPAYTLTYTDDDEEPAYTFVQDVIEHLQQVWRYHDGTFSTLTTTRPAHGRAPLPPHPSGTGLLPLPALAQTGGGSSVVGGAAPRWSNAAQPMHC